MKTNLKIIPQIIDYTTLFVASFLLFFCWIRFYSHKIYLSIILGLIISIILCLLSYMLITNHNKKKNLTKQNKKLLDNLNLQLSFCKSEQVLQFYMDNLPCEYNSCKIIDNYILLNNSTILIPYFDSSVLSLDTFKQLTKQYINQYTTVISCNQYSEDVKQCLQTLQKQNIVIYDLKQTLEILFKTYDLKNIPNIINTTKTKLKPKEIFISIFNRNRTKNYLLVGVCLILYSFFIPYRLYYLITASILLTLAILTRLIPQKI